jgi:DNA-binding response OmpR family regulator
MTNENEKPVALVVEDDRKLSVIFTEAVKKAGFDARPAYDGKQALDELARTTPGIVILDLHIPEISGEKVLAAIRSDARFNKTKVIVTTADQLKATLLEPQADLVLLKPVSFTQLTDLARRMRETI